MRERVTQSKVSNGYGKTLKSYLAGSQERRPVKGPQQMNIDSPATAQQRYEHIKGLNRNYGKAPPGGAA